MAPLRQGSLAAFLLLASHAAAWTVTNYLIASSSQWIGQSTMSTQTATVSINGSVTPSPISTNVSTTTYLDTQQGAFIPGPGTYIVTVTDLYLPLSATSVVCALTLNEILGQCSTPVPTGPYKFPTPAISSRWFAPLLVQNPSSCTKTTFSYTSSTTVMPTDMPSSIYLQATDSAEAVFVTTYVVTLSTDLGGQAATTTFADIYLNSGAVVGLTPNEAVSTLLEQCVDPSSSLCFSSVTVTDILGCQLGQKITYPPTGPSGNNAGPTNGAGGGSGSGGSGGGSAQTTSKGGADGMAGRVERQVVLGVAGMVAAYLL